MKIKRSRWRTRVWAFGSSFAPLLLLLLLLNFPCGLWRNSNDVMSPSLVDGDLLLIQKWGVEYAPGDLVLSCSDKCKILRIVATKGDELKINKDEVLVNGERLFTGMDSMLRAELIAWRFSGGYVVRADTWKDEDFSKNWQDLVLSREEIVGKVMMLLRVRGF